MTTRSSAQMRFRRQWTLLQPQDSIPGGWKHRQVPTGQVLAWHPDLSVRCLESGGNVVIILGILVDHERLEGGVFTEEGFQKWLHAAAGNYAVLECREERLRAYSDPGGMMGIYYKDGRVSSSPRLLPEFEIDQRLMEEYPLQGTDDWYTGSICPFKGVRVLLANHWLEPTTGKTGRFWPIVQPDSLPHGQGVARAADLLRSIVQDVCSQHEVLISITGGKDSRVNLAAAKDGCPSAEFFTLRGESVKSPDVEIVGKLVSQFSLNHKFEDIDAADPELTALYDEISGGISLGARRDVVGGCLKLAGSRRVHLSGNLGAVAKAYYWRREKTDRVRKEVLLREFESKAPCLDRGVQEWLDSVPSTLSPATVYNLMYLEQRGGRWMGIGENASSLFYSPFTPFSSRMFFEVISGMPEESQRDRDLHVDLIQVLWPELLDVPFCRASRKFSALLPKPVKTLLKRLLRR